MRPFALVWLIGFGILPGCKQTPRAEASPVPIITDFEGVTWLNAATNCGDASPTSYGLYVKTCRPTEATKAYIIDDARQADLRGQVNFIQVEMIGKPLQRTDEAEFRAKVLTERLWAKYNTASGSVRFCDKEKLKCFDATIAGTTQWGMTYAALMRARQP